MQLHSSLNSVLCEYHPALCWLPSTFTISVFICCVYSLSLIIFRSPNLLFSSFPHTCLWSGVLNEFAASLSLMFFCCLPVCFWKLMWWEWRHSRLLMLCIDLEMQLYCLTIIHFNYFYFFDRLLSSHLYRHGCLCKCVTWASKCYLNSPDCKVII